jgi:hypothetical protein
VARLPAYLAILEAVYRSELFLESSWPPRTRGVLPAHVALEPGIIQATIGESRYLLQMFPGAPRP